MTFTYALQTPALNRLMDALGPSMRRALLEVAARGVQIAVSGHIERLGATRHRSASALGAEPTGHYERAAADVTSEVDGNVGVVTIPIAGISRAFHDVTIRPGAGKKALTIPIAAESYGVRVVEMQSAGWSIFRPPAKGAKMTSRDPRRFSEYKNILMGSSGGDAPVPLYALVSVVRQPQDRTLLPSDEELGGAAENGVRLYLQEVMRQ